MVVVDYFNPHKRIETERQRSAGNDPHLQEIQPRPSSRSHGMRLATASLGTRVKAAAPALAAELGGDDLAGDAGEIVRAMRTGRQQQLRRVDDGICDHLAWGAHGDQATPRSCRPNKHTASQLA